MSKEKNTVPAVKQADEMVVADGAMWGAADDMDNTDITVSKIYHQQALSKFVQDGKAQAGDWCDSLTGEVLAKKDEPLEVIIFSSNKKLLISESKVKHNPKFEFKEAQNVTPENCNLPWEEETEFGIIKRQLQYNYFVLLPNKLDELPYVLSFSSTKIKVAKKLNTMIAKLSRQKLPSAAYIFDIRSVKETGDKGSWFGAEITQGFKCTPEQFKAAHDWYVQIRSTKVTIEEGESDTPSQDIPF